MAFHIEISSALDRTRALNLDEAELGKEILEPWVAGLPFGFGGRDWEPRESRLTILEGPAIAAPEDAEAGWLDAMRAAEDVTRAMLEGAEASAPAQIAVLVEGNTVEEALRGLRAGKPPRQVPWSAAAERIAGRDPEVSAVILVVKRPGIAWPDL